MNESDEMPTGQASAAESAKAKLAIVIQTIAREL
jgi:hypothetical protein